MVGHGPLKPSILVRIQVPQPSLTIRTRNFETRGFVCPASPMAGLVSLWRRPASQKNCLFPLKEKNGARKIKKCKGNFSALLRVDMQEAGFPDGSLAKIFPLKLPQFLPARFLSVIIDGLTNYFSIKFTIFF